MGVAIVVFSSLVVCCVVGVVVTGVAGVAGVASIVGVTGVAFGAVSIATRVN